MSALVKADMCAGKADVRFEPIEDIAGTEQRQCDSTLLAG
jgi:hypothetical protein